MSGLSNPALFRTCADLALPNPRDPAGAAAFTLRLLARRIQDLTGEIDELNTQITTTIEAHVPSCCSAPESAPTPRPRSFSRQATTPKD